MKVKAVLMSSVLVMALSLGAASSRAVDQRNFWFLNNTSKTITRIYIADHTRPGSSWSNNILGQATLPHGIGTAVYFRSDIASSCVIDLKLVFNDGTEQTYTQGRNVCLYPAVAFNPYDSVGLRA